MQRRFLLPVAVALGLLHACAPKYSKYISRYERNAGEQPDYKNLFYWAAHPYKHDLSDSLPAFLSTSYRYDSSVDVFFLHPTTFTQKESTAWNAELDDAALNAKTDYGTILYQASAFNEFRVFAPRYRQAHLRAYYTAEEAAGKAFDTAYADIKNAFQYYLTHFNNDRPIIIASHSQGTTHGMRLLKEFFENKPMSNKLVAAYLIGMYIPGNYYSTLSVCKDSLQVGCICGWRSFQSGHIAPYVAKEKVTGLIVNPLTWTTENIYASRSLNKGSVLKNFNRKYYQVADAKIHDGILWITRPEFPGSFLLRMKNYHIADINFFYGNIRENVRQRVEAFRKQRTKTMDH